MKTTLSRELPMTTSDALPPTPTLAQACSQTCSEVVASWQAERCPSALFHEELKQIAARVPTWIAPASVLAGVRDVFLGATAAGRPLEREELEALGSALAHRLSAEGLLGGPARRATFPAPVR